MSDVSTQPVLSTMLHLMRWRQAQTNVWLKLMKPVPVTTFHFGEKELPHLWLSERCRWPGSPRHSTAWGCAAGQSPASRRHPSCSLSYLNSPFTSSWKETSGDTASTSITVPPLVSHPHSRSVNKLSGCVSHLLCQSSKLSLAHPHLSFKQKLGSSPQLSRCGQNTAWDDGGLFLW